MIDHVTVQRLFDYDSETGDLWWLVERRKGKETPCRRIAGTLHSRGYLTVEIFGKEYKVHRLVFFWMTGEFPHDQIDHIDGNKRNNEWVNLRVVSNSENKHNQGIYKNNKSGVIGVSFNKQHGKWVAYIKTQGVVQHLGTFAHIEDATIARRNAEVILGFHPNHGKRPSWRG